MRRDCKRDSGEAERERSRSPVPSDSSFLRKIQEEETAIADKQARPSGDTDTEADEGAAPRGAGPQGHGEPLYFGDFEKRRVLCDGAGLCSLGRWPPEQRPCSESAALRRLWTLVSSWVDNLPTSIGLTAGELFASLADGQVTTSPFPASLVAQWTAAAVSLLDSYGLDAGARSNDRKQCVHIRLLQAILRGGGDPDVQGMEHLARGVKLGIDTKLPSTPAVYERKTRWSLREQWDADDHRGNSVEAVWRDNYRTAVQHHRLIAAQLEDHAARGLALKLTEKEARDRFPDLTIVSLGAVEKIAEPSKPEDVRLLMDGTYGVNLNTKIRVRDQDRCPTAADVKRVQREQARGRPLKGLALDVHEAHRLPPVHEDDWHFQGCRAESGGDIFVYMFGVFGYASSAYWWSRLGGALIRAIHLTAMPSQSLWLLMMADDIKVESASTDPEKDVVWVILFLSMLNVPFSWKKIQGGEELSWIGYHVLLNTHSLGISESRANWAIEWCERLARDASVRSEELRSGIGRLAFIAGALEYERPFLAPLYSFSSRTPHKGLVTLPLYVKIVLVYLSRRFKLRRHYPSAVCHQHAMDGFRVDAHAEGEEIGIGGWLPTRDENGRIQTSLSAWFSVQLDRTSAPWAFHRGLPFRAIASLEALATLVGVISFNPFWPDLTAMTISAPTITDNRGNKYALSRLQTTKFPLCVVVMELAAQLESRRMRLNACWAPREVNQEADRLSKGDASGFAQQHRVNISVREHPWLVMNELMESGVAFATEQQLGSSSSKRLGAASSSGPQPARDRQKYQLRTEQPW